MDRSTSPAGPYPVFLSLAAVVPAGPAAHTATAVDEWSVDVMREGEGVLASASGAVGPEQQSVEVPGLQVTLNAECEVLEIRVELLSMGEAWWVAAQDQEVCTTNPNTFEVPELDFQWTGPEPPTIEPGALEFVLAQGAASSQSFTITYGGAGDWTVRSADGEPGWLTVEPASGTVAAGEPATVVIRADASGLQPGAHGTTLLVEGFPGPTVEVQVTLTVLAGPRIGLAPAALSFETDQGQAPPPQTLTVTHTGEAGTLTWTASPDQDWLQLEPGSGALAAGGSQEVTVAVVSQELNDGPYSGTITVSAAGASNSPRTAAVALTVNEVFTSSISGSVVVDDQGLQGVTVTLDGPDGARTATTGSAGGYGFGELRDGEYTVAISDYPANVEFSTTTRTLSLGVGDSRTVDFVGTHTFYTLSATKSGQGTLTSSPAGISIGTSGTSDSGTFEPGTQVALTADPAAGWRIASWGGACSSVAASSSQCTVVMDGDRTASVTIEQILYTLSVTKAGQGTVTSSPAGISIATSGSSDSGTFPAGTRVTLTADPASGWLIQSWGGACGRALDSSTCVLEMTSNLSASVSFYEPLPDLVITTGLEASPRTVLAGGRVTLSDWTVANQGTASSGGFTNGFYLSTDPVITAADRFLGENSNSGLAPGASFTWGGPTLTIPDDVQPGTYYIGILVDRTDSVTESNEANNYVSVQINVDVLI